jgi:hypothetical protein
VLSLVISAKQFQHLAAMASTFTFIALAISTLPFVVESVYTMNANAVEWFDQTCYELIPGTNEPKANFLFRAWGGALELVADALVRSQNTESVLKIVEYNTPAPGVSLNDYKLHVDQNDPA